jgi:threonine dehydrogenase-like Zn-dependent dehydrogenase
MARPRVGHIQFINCVPLYYGLVKSDAVLDMELVKAAPAELARAGRAAPFDLVVESVGGGADTLNAAAAAVRRGGVVSVLGVFLGPVRLDTLPLLLKEATLAWSYCYARSDEPCDFAEATRLLAAERERAARLATHAVPLAEAERAFALAADRKAGAVKVSVIP